MWFGWIIRGTTWIRQKMHCKFDGSAKVPAMVPENPPIFTKIFTKWISHEILPQIDLFHISLAQKLRK